MSEGSLNPMTEFLLKDRHKEIWYRDTQGRRPYEDEGRDWIYTAKSRDT